MSSVMLWVGLTAGYLLGLRQGDATVVEFLLAAASFALGIAAVEVVGWLIRRRRETA